MDHRDIGGRALRESFAARIDPARLERQRRQRQHQRASDMAGAEQIELRPGVGETLAQGAVGQRFRSPRPLGRRRATPGSFAPSARPAPYAPRRRRGRRARRRRAPSVRRHRARRRSRSAIARGRRSIARDPARARRSPQRRAAARRQRRQRGASSACHSSAPPPIVPLKAPDGRTTMRAPLSRGLDPSTLTRLTSAPAPFGLERFDQAIKRQHGDALSLLAERSIID